MKDIYSFSTQLSFDHNISTITGFHPHRTGHAELPHHPVFPRILTPAVTSQRLPFPCLWVRGSTSNQLEKLTAFRTHIRIIHKLI